MRVLCCAQPDRWPSAAGPWADSAREWLHVPQQPDSASFPSLQTKHKKLLLKAFMRGKAVHVLFFVFCFRYMLRNILINKKSHIWYYLTSSILKLTSKQAEDIEMQTWIWTLQRWVRRKQPFPRHLNIFLLIFVRYLFLSTLAQAATWTVHHWKCLKSPSCHAFRHWEQTYFQEF